MRFWLVLGVIGLILFFCFRSCQAKFMPSKDKKPASEKVENPAKGAPAPSGGPVASLGGLVSLSGPPVPAEGQQIDSGGNLPVDGSRPYRGDYGSRYTGPIVTEVYVFRNRVVPPVGSFGQGGGSGGSSATVSVDEPSNAIVIRGSLDAVRSLKTAARELDLVSGEAYCDAWMLFVRGDRVRDFEASLEYSGGGFGGEIGGSISSDGFGVAVPLGTLRAKLQILASNGLLEVVDRPQLRLSSGHRSEVATGEEVPFPTTVIRDGIATTSIEFKRVGLLFAVEPLFLGGGMVRMDVTAENGLLGATRKVGDVEVPSITRQAVKSAATLTADTAMVIGGLETVRREKRFGLFGEKESMQSGRLYVAIMLSSGYPKAKPVIGPAGDFPLLPPGENGDPGIYDERLFPDGLPTMGGVLPDLGAAIEERRFIEDYVRRKGSK
jgi:hypothetical protein